MHPLVKAFQKALEAGVPLIAVNTQDPALTIHTLAQSRPANLTNLPHAILQWDLLNGLTITPYESVLRENSETPKMLQSKEVLEALLSDGGGAWAKNLPLTLHKLTGVHENTTIFIHNAQRFLQDSAVMQAIWSLRDHFKAGSQSLVLLGPQLRIPQELTYDVLVLDDPLPSRTTLEGILTTQYHNATVDYPSLPPLTPAVVSTGLDALTGLSGFAAEQAIAMAITTKGLDLPRLWQRKYETIEQTPGLKIYRGAETFDAIGGVAHIKTFLTRILQGRRPPKAIVFLDEVEKAIAGAQSAHGDNTGVSQDLHRQLLEYMQNSDATGILMLGPPGCSKSLVAKAAGNQAHIPTIELDLGAIKAGQVGASEHNMRQALKVISSISNQEALFLATCNSIDAIAPELRRRFRLGTFLFPLPDEEERHAIWAIYKKLYHLDEIPESLRRLPWSGAEIRQCADIAWRLQIPVDEAAQYIVPVSTSAKQAIDALYTKADGAFLCASYPGPFRQDPQQRTQPPRKAASRKVLLNTHTAGAA